MLNSFASDGWSDDATPMAPIPTSVGTATQSPQLQPVARVPLAYARALAVGEKLKFYVGGNHATRTAARELLSLEIPLAVDMGPRLAAATTLVDGAHAESHSQFDSRCGGDRLAISRPPPGMVVTPFLWRSGVPN